MTFVIVSNFNGDINVYNATVETAMDILNNYKEYIDKKIINLSAIENKNFILYENIAKIFNKILTKKVGEQISKSITLTEDIKNELIIWLFNNKVSFDYSSHSNEYSISAYSLFQKSSEFMKLSFLKDNPNYNKENTFFLLEDELKTLKAYETIFKNEWDENMEDSKKIHYILSFVNQFTRQDDQYCIKSIFKY